jgi:hypothetical protein
VTSENPTNSPTPPAPKSHEDANDKTPHVQNKLPPVNTPEVHPEPSHSHYEITCNKKRDGWDRVKMGAEFVGICFLIIYTLYTALIYCANKKAAEAAHDTLGEIQKQTILQRQQVVGTEAANITLANPLWDQKTKQVTLVLQNDGMITGTVNSFDAIIWRKSLPEQKTIADPIHISFSNIKIVKTGSYREIRVIPWPLSDIPEDNPTTWPGDQVFTMDVKLIYNDGFNDIIPISYCFFYLPRYFVHTPEINPFGFRGGGGWEGSQQDCPVKEALSEFWARKKQVEEVTRERQQSQH